jgi:thiamine-monophosphate kinase
MDVSDGLAKDLARLCAASGCAARVTLAAIPLSAAAARAVAAEPGLDKSLIAGGDDYEILATVPAPAAAAFRAAAKAAGVAVTEIGDIGAGEGIRIEAPDGSLLPLDRSGWDHFA